MPSLTSRFIGKPLALGHDQETFSAGSIVKTKGLAMVVSKIEFGSVALQVGGTAMLVHAVHASLKNREEVFGGIGMRKTGWSLTHIFFRAVIDCFMRRVAFSDPGILTGFVGHQGCRAWNARSHFLFQGLSSHVIDVKRADMAIALDQRKDRFLVVVAAVDLPSRLATDESLIRFDGAAVAANQTAIILHGFADTMGQEPRRLDSDAKGALQLVRADALLARRNQEDGLQPDMHRDVTGLKYGSDLDGKGLAAVIALVSAYAGAFAAHLADALVSATVRAYRAIGPKVLFNELIGRFFVVEVRGGKDGFCHGAGSLM